MKNILTQLVGLKPAPSKGIRFLIRRLNHLATPASECYSEDVMKTYSAQNLLSLTEISYCCHKVEKHCTDWSSVLCIVYFLMVIRKA